MMAHPSGVGLKHDSWNSHQVGAILFTFRSIKVHFGHPSGFCVHQQLVDNPGTICITNYSQAKELMQQRMSWNKWDKVEMHDCVTRVNKHDSCQI